VQCPQCAGNVQLPHFASAKQPPKTTKAAKPLAIASLALSLSSVLIGPFGFAPGIVCGHLALRRAKRSGSTDGKGLARAGLVVGYMALAVMLALFGGMAAAFRSLSTETVSATTKSQGAQSAKTQSANDSAGKVEVEFGGFEAGPFGERAIVLVIRNRFSKPVTELQMIYAYVDAQGRTLKEFPMTKMSNELAPAGTTNRVVSMAAFMPPTTTTVKVSVTKAAFVDGSEWAP
jgi:hypothetical protein